MFTHYCRGSCSRHCYKSGSWKGYKEVTVLQYAVRLEVLYNNMVEDSVLLGHDTVSFSGTSRHFDELCCLHLQE